MPFLYIINLDAHLKFRNKLHSIIYYIQINNQKSKKLQFFIQLGRKI